MITKLERTLYGGLNHEWRYCIYCNNKFAAVNFLNVVCPTCKADEPTPAQKEWLRQMTSMTCPYLG